MVILSILQDHHIVLLVSVLTTILLIFGFLFPIFQPHPLKVLTILGSMAAVRGTRMKMNDLWIAYANASCVPIPQSVSMAKKSMEYLPTYWHRLLYWLFLPPYNRDRKVLPRPDQSPPQLSVSSKICTFLESV